MEETDPEDNDARTSLLVAASLGSLPIVKLLVEAGANLKAVTAVRNPKSRNPLNLIDQAMCPVAERGRGRRASSLRIEQR